MSRGEPTRSCAAELRRVKDITDSPAFFDGKHARAIDAISAPAPHAMVRAVLDS